VHPHVVVAGDIISNLHKLDRTTTQLDTIPDDQDLQPELLITFGNSGISKRLKLFLRKNKPAHHWHIQPAGDAADTYQSITKVIYTEPEIFFTEANQWKTPDDSSYAALWKEVQLRGNQLVKDTILFSPQGEITQLEKVLDALPDNTNLHLANSLSVRLANYIGLSSKHTTSFSNRGTSGIDGSTSTAIGMALVTENPVVLVTGDMAFFYDRNAFWHNQLPSNFYVVILNNHAGGIFGIINGPARQPELEEYFETNQKLTAENLCRDYDLPYTFVPEQRDLPDLNNFFKSADRPKILEIETNLETNKKAFKHLQNEIEIDGATLRLETNKGI
jgi:2-succinyl-5-enolpyruvyl-6-hydroxy-3-cyclohexene-1-carboxylate synthase